MRFDLENMSDDVKRLNPGVGSISAPRRHKYNASPTMVDGHRFDSKGEADRYRQLKAMQDAGEISGLMLQPVFILQGKFRYGGKTVRAIKYIADFQYKEGGFIIIEDFKGRETDVYRLKRKLFLKKMADGEYGEKVRYRVTRR